MEVFYIIVDSRDFSKLTTLTQSYQWQIHSKYTEIFNKIQKNDLILFCKESHYSWDVILKLKEKQVIKIKNNDDSEFREQAKTLSFKFQNKDFLSEYLNSFDVPNMSKLKPGIYFFKKITVDKKQEKLKEIKHGIPEKIFSIVKQSKRDKNKVRDLKSKYSDKCQICNYCLILENKKCHSEVHHLRPIGNEGGNDDTDNMIVLCPNHHKAFDYSVLRLDLSGSKVIDLDEQEITKIKFKNDHKLSKENITYQYYRRMI